MSTRELMQENKMYVDAQARNAFWRDICDQKQHKYTTEKEIEE